jgi:hypothetical protein
MYAAVGRKMDTDATSYLTKVEFAPPDGRLKINFNPNAGLTPEQLENMARSAINVIAVFYNHCRAYAAEKGIPADEVNNVTKNSLALRLIRDLDNMDKHPGAAAKESGLNPALKGIRRALRLNARPGEGPSYFGVAFNQDQRTGQVVQNNVAITLIGEVINRDTGERLMHFGTMLDGGVVAWERFLDSHGINSPTDPGHNAGHTQ